jgi:hypothetical protein
MDGDAFEEPQPQANNPNDKGFRSANVYFHLRRAKKTFCATAQKLWPQNGSIPMPKLPGSEGEPLLVCMQNDASSSRYNYADNSASPNLEFGKGNTAADPPIGDPALDCEVIYHEYTHAALNAIQPDIFDLILNSTFRDSINEGVAFYYGCTLSERVEPPLDDGCTQSARWGEFAYQHAKWEIHRSLRRANPPEADHDYLSVYGVFPSYENDPDPDPVKDDKRQYACGMVWARTLWDVRCLLDYEIADAIILRGLNLAGGIQSELETLAEAILHADGEQAAGGPDHASALRLIFASRGIMADAPIHDLVSFDLDGQTHLLAATESASANPPLPGCLYSTDDGDTWQPLGAIPPAGSGPVEVVALTTAEFNQNSSAKVAIWAVSEYWVTGEGAGPAAVARLYRCDLDANSDITEAAWQHVADVPGETGVFSIAALAKPGGAAGEFWLFLGSENGLHHYDNGWLSGVGSTPPPYVPEERFLDLAVIAGPQPKLLAPLKHTLHIFEPTINDVQVDFEETGLNSYGLAVAVDSSGNHVWVGTAFNGIYHFDLQSGGLVNWQPDPAVGRPTHSLVVEEVDQNPTTWRVFAGTNNGVYRCVYHLNQAGEQEFEKDSAAFNQLANPNEEAIEGTSVTALRRVGNRLLAGTAQRGLWRGEVGDNAGWARLTTGLSRVGLLTDADVLMGAAAWVSADFASGDLPAGDVATRVLHVSHNNFNTLSFRVTQGNANNLSLRLFYVAPQAGQGAGLQRRTLQANGSMAEAVQAGYYVLAVRANAAENNFVIEGRLT